MNDTVRTAGFVGHHSKSLGIDESPTLEFYVPQVKRRCDGCFCTLRSTNPEPYCSPCQRKQEQREWEECL